MQAHRRRRTEIDSRSILRDSQVTLITLEGQLKVCGCFLVLLVAIAGLIASGYAIFYVSGSSLSLQFLNKMLVGCFLVLCWVARIRHETLPGQSQCKSKPHT